MSKVVSLKGKEDRHQVTQLQLEQLIYAKRKLREARSEYEQIRTEIQRELNSGATIQSGVHTASTSTFHRFSVA